MNMHGLSGRLRAFVQWIQLLGFRGSRAEFYGDLAEMFVRGESMLSFLEGELANAVATGQGSRAVALRVLLRRYTGGEAAGLAGLLRGVVPPGDDLMLAGVERSPHKAQSLRALAEAVRLQERMRTEVITRCIAPLVMALICGAMIAVMSDVLLAIDRSTPEYVRDQVWGGFNGLAKALADFSVGYGLQTLALLFAGLALAVWSLPRWIGRCRLRVDGWPLYSLYRDYQAGMLLSALAMLLQAQGTLRGSLEDLAQRGRPWARWQIHRVIRSLDESPNATIRAFGRGLLSPHLLARAATLHRSAAQFSDVLVQLGTTEGQRVFARVQRAALTMNVCLVSVLGGIAVVLGMASITVPGTFASVMEPSSLMAAKRMYELRKRTEFQPPPSQDGNHTRSNP